MTQDECKTFLAEHSAWLADNTKGKRADLRNASIKNADLENANLTGANLTGANLTNANLRNANLTCANLAGANLWGAKLVGANLMEVHDVIDLGRPNGWWAFAYLWGGTIWVRVGCRTKFIADGRVYWAGKEDRREVLAALDYAEAVARLRGWDFKL